MYISTAVVSSIIVGLVAALGLGLVTWFLKIPNLIHYKGEVPATMLFLNQYGLLLGTIFAVVFSLLVFGGITYAIFIVYPSVEAGNRRRNIDASLPYAINYITSMSTAGITPAEIFRLLGDSPIYGQTPWKHGISHGRSTSSGGILLIRSGLSLRVLPPIG